MCSPSRIDCTSADHEDSGDLIEKNSSLAQWFVLVAQLVRAPACKAGVPGSNPGPDEKFSLKLTTLFSYVRYISCFWN